MPKEIEKSLRIVCDYLQMHQEMKVSDCIMVLGTYDERVAERGAELFLEGFAPLVVCSGGLSQFANSHWQESEAEHFAGIIRGMGVSASKILIENRAMNTGENAALIRELLADKGIVVGSAIIVQKPYMERRSYATFKKAWPELEVIATSPKLKIEQYPTAEVSMEKVINSLVGDFQRIMLYPEKGFSIPQEVPQEAVTAFKYLVAAGYDKRLIK